MELMSIEVSIVSVDRLSENERLEMDALYRAYYTGALDEAFAQDLAEKHWVILLKVDGRICGFSTQRLIPMPDEGMNVLFSGDTIVDSAMRNQSGLAGGFGHLMAYLNERYEPLYWFLICKGARTYRFLPTFFKRYIPSPPSPPSPHPDLDLETRLHRVAAKLYPSNYQSETGILHFSENKDRLIDDALREDPASRFFRERNPNWQRGDELCCFAPLGMDNLNRLGERVIRVLTPRWDIAQ